MNIFWFLATFLTFFFQSLAQEDCNSENIKESFLNIQNYLIKEQCYDCINKTFNLTFKMLDFCTNNHTYVGILKNLAFDSNTNKCNNSTFVTPLKKSILCHLENTDCVPVFTLDDIINTNQFCSKFIKLIDCIRNTFIENDDYAFAVREYIQNTIGKVATTICIDNPCVREPCNSGKCILDNSTQGFYCECQDCFTGDYCLQDKKKGCSVHDWEICFMRHYDKISKYIEKLDLQSLACEIPLIIKDCVLSSEVCYSYEEKLRYNMMKRFAEFLNFSCISDSMDSIATNFYTNVMSPSCVSGFDKCEKFISNMLTTTRTLNNMRLYQHVDDFIQFYNCFEPYMSICFKDSLEEIKNIASEIYSQVSPPFLNLPCYETKQCITAFDVIFNYESYGGYNLMSQLLFANETKSYDPIDVIKYKNDLIKAKNCIQNNKCDDIFEMDEVYTDIKIRENLVSKFIEIDLCDDGKRCANKGYCYSNICYCIPGYSGNMCEDVNDNCNLSAIVDCLATANAKINKAAGMRKFFFYDRFQNHTIFLNTTLNSCGYNNHLNDCITKTTKTCDFKGLTNENTIKLMNKQCAVNSYIDTTCIGNCTRNKCKDDGYCIGGDFYERGYKCVCKEDVVGYNCEFGKITCDVDYVNKVLNDILKAGQDSCDNYDCGSLNDEVNNIIERLINHCQSKAEVRYIIQNLYYLNGIGWSLCDVAPSCQSYNDLLSNVDFTDVLRGIVANMGSIDCDYLNNIRYKIFLKYTDCPDKGMCYSALKAYDKFHYALSGYMCSPPCNDIYKCSSINEICVDLGRTSDCQKPNCDFANINSCYDTILRAIINCSCSNEKFNYHELDKCNELLNACYPNESSLLKSIGKTSRYCYQENKNCNPSKIIACVSEFKDDFISAINSNSTVCNYQSRLKTCFESVDTFNNNYKVYELERYETNGMCKNVACYINHCHSGGVCSTDMFGNQVCKCPDCYDGKTCGVSKLTSFCSLPAAMSCTFISLGDIFVKKPPKIIYILTQNIFSNSTNALSITDDQQHEIETFIKISINNICYGLEFIDKCFDKWTSDCVLTGNITRLNFIDIIRNFVKEQCLNEDELFDLIKSTLFSCYSHVSKVASCAEAELNKIDSFVEIPNLVEIYQYITNIYSCIKPTLLQCSPVANLLFESILAEIKNSADNSVKCLISNGCLSKMVSDIEINYTFNISLSVPFSDVVKCINEDICLPIYKIEYFAKVMNYAFAYDYKNITVLFETPICQLDICIAEMMSTIYNKNHRKCLDRKEECYHSSSVKDACTTLISVRRCQKNNQCFKLYTSHESLYCKTLHTLSLMCSGGCINDPCKNGSKCEGQGMSEYYCMCKSGNYGKNCENEYPKQCIAEELNQYLITALKTYSNVHCDDSTKLEMCKSGRAYDYKNLLLYYTQIQSNGGRLCNDVTTNLISGIVYTFAQYSIDCRSNNDEKDQICLYSDMVISCFESYLETIIKYSINNNNSNKCVYMLKMRKCIMETLQDCHSDVCKNHLRAINQISTTINCQLPCSNDKTCSYGKLCKDKGDKEECLDPDCSNFGIADCIEKTVNLLDGVCGNGYDYPQNYDSKPDYPEQPKDPNRDYYDPITTGECQFQETDSNEKFCYDTFVICRDQGSIIRDTIDYMLDDLKNAMDPCGKMMHRSLHCGLAKYISECIDYKDWADSILTQMMPPQNHPWCVFSLESLQCMEGQMFKNSFNSITIQQGIMSLKKHPLCQKYNVLMLCYPNPCLNSGKCFVQEFANEYECICSSCYSGDKCEFANSSMLVESTEGNFPTTNYVEFSKQCNTDQVGVCVYETIMNYIGKNGKLFENIDISNMTDVMNSICGLIKELKFCIDIFAYDCKSSNYKVVLDIIKKVFNYTNNQCSNLYIFGLRLMKIIMCVQTVNTDELLKNLYYEYFLPRMDKFLSIKLLTPTLPYLSQHYDFISESFTELLKYIPVCILDNTKVEISLISDIIDSLNPLYQNCWNAKKCINQFDDETYDKFSSNPILMYPIAMNITDCYIRYEKAINCIEAGFIDPTCTTVEVIEVESYLLARKKSLFKLYDIEEHHVCYKKVVCRNGGKCVRGTDLDKYTCRCRQGYSGDECQLSNGKDCYNEHNDQCILEFQSELDMQMHFLCSHTYKSNLADTRLNFQFQNCELQNKDTCYAIKKVMGCMMEGDIDCLSNDLSTLEAKYCKLLVKANTSCHQKCIRDHCLNGGICYTQLIDVSSMFKYTRCSCSDGYSGEICELIEEESCNKDEIINSLKKYSSMAIESWCDSNKSDEHCEGENNHFIEIEKYVMYASKNCSDTVKLYLNSIFKYSRFECAYIGFTKLQNFDKGCAASSRFVDCLDYDELFNTLMYPDRFSMEDICKSSMNRRKCIYDATSDCTDLLCISVRENSDKVLHAMGIPECNIPCYDEYACPITTDCIDLGDRQNCHIKEADVMRCNKKSVEMGLRDYTLIVMDAYCDIDTARLYCEENTFVKLENDINEYIKHCDEDSRKLTESLLMKFDCDHIPIRNENESVEGCKLKWKVRNCFDYDGAFDMFKNFTILPYIDDICTEIMNVRGCVHDSIKGCTDELCNIVKKVTDEQINKISLGKCEIPCAKNYCNDEECIDTGTDYDCSGNSSECNLYELENVIKNYTKVLFETLCSADKATEHCSNNQFEMIKLHINESKRSCNSSVISHVDAMMDDIFECQYESYLNRNEFTQGCKVSMHIQHCLYSGDIMSFDEINSNEICRKALQKRKCLFDATSECTDDICSKTREKFDAIMGKLSNYTCKPPCEYEAQFCPNGHVCVDTGDDYICQDSKAMCTHESINRCINKAFETIHGTVCDGPMLKREYRKSPIDGLVKNFINKVNKNMTQSDYFIEYDKELFDSSCQEIPQDVLTCLNVFDACPTEHDDFFLDVVEIFKLVISHVCNPVILIPVEFNMICSGKDIFLKCTHNVNFASPYYGSKEDYCEFSDNTLNCFEESSKNSNQLMQSMLIQSLGEFRFSLAYDNMCQSYDPCYHNPCYNGGVCSHENNVLTCTCPHCYTGEFCNIYSPIYIKNLVIEYNKNSIIDKTYHGFAKQCSLNQFSVCTITLFYDSIDKIINLIKNTPFDIENMYPFIQMGCDILKNLQKCLEYFTSDCQTTTKLRFFNIIKEPIEFLQNICFDFTLIGKYMEVTQCFGDLDMQNVGNNILNKCIIPNMSSLLEIKVIQPTLPYLHLYYDLIHNLQTCVTDQLPLCILEKLNDLKIILDKVIDQLNPSHQKCLGAKECISNFDSNVYGYKLVPLFPFFKESLGLDDVYDIYEQTHDCIKQSINLDSQSCNIYESAELWAFLQARMISVLVRFEDSEIHPCFRNVCDNGTCVRLSQFYKCECFDGFTGDKCSDRIGCSDDLYTKCIYDVQSILDMIPHPICNKEYGEDGKNDLSNCIVMDLPDYCSAVESFTDCLGVDYIAEACKLEDDKNKQICDLYVNANTLCYQKCIQNPCENGGKCMSEREGLFEYKYECECPEGFKGENCEIGGNTTTEIPNPDVNPLICDNNDVAMLINDIYKNSSLLKCLSFKEATEICDSNKISLAQKNIDKLSLVCSFIVTNILISVQNKNNHIENYCSGNDWQPLEMADCVNNNFVLACFNFKDYINDAESDDSITKVSCDKYYQSRRCVFNQIEENCQNEECISKMTAMLKNIAKDIYNNKCVDLNCDDDCRIGEICKDYGDVALCQKDPNYTTTTKTTKATTLSSSNEEIDIAIEIILDIPFKQDYKDLKNQNTQQFIKDLAASLSKIHDNRPIKIKKLIAGSVKVEYEVVYDGPINDEKIKEMIEAIKDHINSEGSITINDIPVGISESAHLLINDKKVENIDNMCSLYNAAERCKHNSSCYLDENAQANCACSVGFNGIFCEKINPESPYIIGPTEMAIIIGSVVACVLIIALFILCMTIKRGTRYRNFNNAIPMTTFPRNAPKTNYGQNPGPSQVVYSKRH
ncbi:hypothetical protein A3Q56_01458 [Intoshia linei]|uniref:EGF-like domain-containing protein n=1 Tax=Intoshia linei TaxID=1819745 RepID=A0A177BBE4_9BILA|nr:hypothetical protein A3Q56_01458 [Intoshia linei]